MTEHPSRSKPKCPTEKQYGRLRILGSGAAQVTGTKGDIEPLLRRGWVTAEPPDGGERRYYAWIRITPDGLRALAEAVERYGLPNFDSLRRKAAA